MASDGGGQVELPPREEVTRWIGLLVTDRHGEPVGTVRTIYADEATGEMEWAVVDRDGGQAAFVPLLEASEQDGTVRVVVEGARVADAPPFPDAGRLTPEQDIELYRHYGVPYSRERSQTVLPTGEPVGTEAGAEPLPDAGPVAAEPVPVAVEPVQPEPALVDDPEGSGPVELADVAVPVDPPLPDEPSVDAPAVTPVESAVPAPPPAPEPPTPAPPTSSGWPLDAPRHAPAPSASGGAGLEPALLAALAVLVAVAGVARALRGRRRTTPAERAARQVRAATTTLRDTTQVQSRALAKRSEKAAADAAATARRARQDAARRAARAAAGAAREVDQARRTGRRATSSAASDTRTALQTAARRSAETARAGAASAGGAVSTAGSRAWSVPAGAVHTVAEGTAQSVDRRRRKARRAWRRTTRRLALVVGLGAGYVTGARAGREHYDQIVQRVSRAVGRG